jgi:hypothetical protein
MSGMNSTTARSRWSRLLVIVGGIAMLVGALDPLEGSLVILPGSGLVTLGTLLGQTERALRAYWVLIFTLILVGVGAMFGLSAVGGIGGRSGHSMWWGLLILPYPVGWVMGIVSLLFRSVRSIRRPRAA